MTAAEPEEVPTVTPDSSEQRTLVLSAFPGEVTRSVAHHARFRPGGGRGPPTFLPRLDQQQEGDRRDDRYRDGERNRYHRDRVGSV